MGYDLALTFARYKYYAVFFSSIMETSILTTKTLSAYTIAVFLLFQLSIKPKLISCNSVYKFNPLIVMSSRVVLVLSGLYTSLLYFLNRSTFSNVAFRQDGLDIISSLISQLGIILFLLCVSSGILILCKKSYILIPFCCLPLIFIEILTQGRTLTFILILFLSIIFISSNKITSIPSSTNVDHRLRDIKNVRSETDIMTSSREASLCHQRLKYGTTKNKNMTWIYILVISIVLLIIGVGVLRTTGAIEDGLGFIGFIFFADVFYSFWSTPIAIDYYNFNSYQADVALYLQNAVLYMIPSAILKIISSIEKYPLSGFAQTLYNVYDSRLGFGLATNIISEAYIAGGLSFCYLSPIIIASILRIIEQLSLYRSVAGFIFLIYFSAYARLIVRDNFYISFFTLVGLMTFLGSWIFFLQPRTDFSEPRNLRG